jgi:hypothetical protein
MLMLTLYPAVKVLQALRLVRTGSSWLEITHHLPAIVAGTMSFVGLTFEDGGGFPERDRWPHSMRICSTEPALDGSVAGRIAEEGPYLGRAASPVWSS